MAPNTKRVFYVNTLSHTVYLDILGRRPDIQVDKLVNDSPDVEVEPILSRAHAYQIGSSRQELAMKFQGHASLLRRCPNLVVLSTNGAGFDTVDLADATAAGVAVVNQAGGNKEGVAEHVMAMLLSLSKRLMLADHAMRSGRSDYDRREFMGDDLLGRTIGIVGLGNVGARVAELCRGLFQMRVLAYDPYLSADQVTARGAEKAETLDDLLRQADYVSINCPHTAGITRQSRYNIAKIAAEQMIDILDGRRPPRLLNPEVWPAYQARFQSILGFRPAD